MRKEENNSPLPYTWNVFLSGTGFSPITGGTCSASCGPFLKCIFVKNMYSDSVFQSLFLHHKCVQKYINRSPLDITFVRRALKNEWLIIKVGPERAHNGQHNNPVPVPERDWRRADSLLFLYILSRNQQKE